ncbi:hypothetical protein [Pontibacter ruber]|uniref:Uncharacterized protein n=1 Tax=Pontibacter ruber TaxID=1343895 RepID=A0ABW5D0T1_9BACT|nr:hypothetical protein [Pontibacter ruber]
MKNLLLSLLIMSSFAVHAQVSKATHLKETEKANAQPISKTDSSVYICKGSSAYAYHKSRACEGLTYCTRDIEAVAKKEAEVNHKRKPCKACH